ncbi:MAG TPA: helix-turn-helix domain-containing protein, partial [Thermoanaerobaculia bacterium]|nr:helix-turn-helix domain-containing protein [Thermoanaerobaculia bacterium]
MTGRSYEHYCAIAKALDLVGERWTLLVVRELLDGPKRYTDLLAGIPGIATDMLAARLKSLEESEIVQRRVLPPPAASIVYELTAHGRKLEATMRELAIFGAGFLERRKGEAFRIQWLSYPLRMMFQPERARGEKLVVQFEAHDEVMHVRVDNGTIETIIGNAESPDVIVAGDIATLTLAARDRAAAREAKEKGKLRVTGTR